MGLNSNIEWCTHTWNIARGCSKVDEDCLFCYMYRDSEKYGFDAKKVIKTKTVFNLPLKIKEPARIFTSSLTDVFHEQIDSYRNEMWDIIRKCPQHIFQILTKRPERIANNLPNDWGEGWDNVWLGTSVGSNKGKHRIDELNKISAKVRFVSFEPLRERIIMDFDLSKIHWLIIGGESGNETGKYRYRRCEVEWIEDFIDLKPAIFVKQLGTYLAKKLKLKDRHGRDINEFPIRIRIREYPIGV